MKDKMKNNERLKTLDDINLYNSYKNNSILRYEVIRWIKELEKFRKIENIAFELKNDKTQWWINSKSCKDLELINKYSVLTSFHPEVTKWIKYFFNIDEKDLK